MDRNEARKELVLRAQGGDRDALTELMTDAVPTVAALVRVLSPRLASREDITQEVLLRAMSHLNSLRDPARFGAYLNEITRNLVFDLSRRGRAMSTLAADPATTEQDPVDHLLRKEENAEVRRALLDLPEVDRQVVLLRHWSDASYEDIASALDLTLSAVQSRLFRARRELARKLRGKGSGDER